MDLVIKKELDDRERTVAGAALDALACMTLDTKARWRVQQLEAVLCEKEPEKELQEP